MLLIFIVNGYKHVQIGKFNIIMVYLWIIMQTFSINETPLIPNEDKYVHVC
jgi:hypothetical protein